MTGLLLVAGCTGEIGGTTDGRPAPLPPPVVNIPPVHIDCTHVGSGRDYQVGPDKEFESIGDVPLESLVAGDTVRIFWRAEGYHEKLMLGGQGTAEQPIRVCGVPGPNGELPVIDGDGATTRPELDFPFDGHQVRGLVIVGHKHDDPYELEPTHITIEGLEIKNAAPPHGFTDKAGSSASYAGNAAGVFVERGDHVTIRACEVHENANGLFIGTAGGDILTTNVLIESNYIHDNGMDDYNEHNVYNEASNVIYQFNRFGPTRGGHGNNIKERSAGVVIRYNWIEDGAHLIDLVDAQEATDSIELPSFHETFIYGNVLLRTGYGPSMIHYGGDSGETEYYRKGTLHFFANTVFVKNDTYDDYDRSAMFEASTNDERIDARNNVFASSVEPTDIRAVTFLGDRDGLAAGELSLAGNWVTNGWLPFDPVEEVVKVVGRVDGLDGSLFGVDPPFASAADNDFIPSASAPLIGAGATLDGLPPVEHQYRPHQQARARSDGQQLTIGAFGL